MTSLPVDEILPELHALLAAGRIAVVQAPPGSGKSTRVPHALLDAPWLGSAKILMLEPRRLAAVNLACWIAAQMGEKAGETVGYAVRFERKSSARTRLEIVTEGLLTRRLQSDPFLTSVGVVIFDEFHERTIHADTSLALCLELQQTVRPDLRIVIMSATLDASKLVARIPGIRIVTTGGGLHPVVIHYLAGSDRDPAQRVIDGVSQALAASRGDILVFLPGSGEIRRSQALLEERHAGENLQILPLYGDLPFAEQERALLPTTRRKVVLATNIAETSLTIEGVTAVVDTGLVRRVRFDRSRALDRLVTERVSAASAAQRTGRAGRLQPGVCFRLWSEQQQQSLLPFDPPEIQTADLCELALNLALWGVNDPGKLTWIDEPSLPALRESRRILNLLGVLDDADRITPRGRRIASLPLHPRLAAMMVAAIDSGHGTMGADLAAVLTERDFLRIGRERLIATSSDLEDRLELLNSYRHHGGRRIPPAGCDGPALRAVDRLSRQLLQRAGISETQYHPEPQRISLLAATAFPDRIAAQREPGSRRYLLVSGLGAALPADTGLKPAPFLVVTALDGGEGGDGRILSGTTLTLDDIFDVMSGRIVTRRRSFWNPVSRRVNVREEEVLGALILRSRESRAEKAEVVEAIRVWLQTDGIGSLLQKTTAAESLQARVLFLRDRFPTDGWPDVSDQELAASVEDWLLPLVESLERPERFSGIELATVIQKLLGWQRQAELDRLAPTHLRVPSGSLVRLDYGDGEQPVLAVKLQELFGLAETPTVAGNRVPVLLHLLSPAGRPIQVTGDLRSFWNSIYPQVKRELKGRYPKHPWPDDPWNAVPTRHTRKRQG